jgi:hypothetical protein
MMLALRKLLMLYALQDKVNNLEAKLSNHSNHHQKIIKLVDDYKKEEGLDKE